MNRTESVTPQTVEPMGSNPPASWPPSTTRFPRAWARPATRVTRLAVLIGACALGSGTAIGQSTPFDYAVRARSDLATGGAGVSTVDRTYFDSATSAAASDSFADNSTGRDFTLDGSASLSTGELRIQNRGSGGPGANQSNTATFLFAEYLDTFRFAGDYTTTPLVLPFTATFDGSWTAANIASGSSDPTVQIFTWLWFADETKSFTQSEWLDTSGLFFGGGELEKRVDAVSVISDGAERPVHVEYAGELELHGIDPLLRAWMGLEVDVNNASANGSWDGDFAHTATLSFDFTGLDVRSASGRFPGTQSVPEPATASLLLLAAGLASLRRLRSRREPPTRQSS